jgi:hypothetical protein
MNLERSITSIGQIDRPTAIDTGTLRGLAWLQRFSLLALAGCSENAMSREFVPDGADREQPGD